MIIIPREKPVIENLNSYYLDIRKLFEHYQGELGSGGIHFKSTSEEGIIFFDKDELLSGVFQGKEGEIRGKEAVDGLIEETAEHNFAISVYSIELSKVYFWSNIPAAEEIYRDLSTEFTDLNKLVKKMGTEKLTGYIEVSINDVEDSGLIFYIDGEIIGGSYSWGKGEVNVSKESQDLLIRKTKELGGVFNVSRIFLTDAKAASGSPESREISTRVISLLEELLGIFKRIVTFDRNIKTNFSTMLKKKLMEKAEKYSFLDPFVAEFEYSGDKITFTGDAKDKELANGIIEVVKELADELGLPEQLMEEIKPWSQKYSKEIAEFDLGF